MVCCLVTRVCCGGRGTSPGWVHCTRLVIHPNDEKLPERKLMRSSKRTRGKREKLTTKEITFRRENKSFRDQLSDLEGQRGVRATPAPNGELPQMVVKQIKSEIYGGS